MAFEGRTVTQLVEGDAGPMAASYVPLRLSGGSLDLVAEIYQDPEEVGGIEVLRRTLIPAMMVALAAAYLLFVRLWRSAATSPNRATPRPYRSVQESDALLETRA
jgi:hypothetical protein